jgi:hypothetical protein
MSFFARNLNKYGQLIDLQSRSTTGATVGEPDPDQVFVTDFNVLSIVSTPIANGVPRGVVGEVVFDNIDTENSPTHKFVIAFLSDISQEVWVLFKGKRYDVMSVINCCEVDNTLILLARLRGPNTLAAASG